MRDLNLQLFHWIAAGYTPTPWLLTLARGIAIGGAWASAATMGWLGWQRPSQRTYLMAVLVAAAATSILAHAIAGGLHLPRPFALGLSPAYISHADSAALPSAHAAVMSVVALTFMLRSGLRDWSVAMIALAAATGWARVYVGVHFPEDIAAGVLLACAVTVVFALLQGLIGRYIPQGEPDTRARADRTWRAP
ncbi:phosphatase PAP2 family protein [Variovorax sp. RT4R15]|uniref:phosphatase PAP2 family protein n=1 Tax=Variovorax sp. RT4R15 TaxID=3443737 RepID=UPI003F4728DA